MDRRVSKPLTTLMWGLALTPVGWVVLFGLFILRARMVLGRWPAPNQPDPKELGLDVHYLAIVAGAPSMLTAALCVLVLPLMLRQRQSWVVTCVALCGLAAVVVLARIDPGNVFAWLGD
jgi:hypothetical protein